MFSTGKRPSQIADEKGLKQSTDTGELEATCQEIINNNPKPVAEYKAGKEPAINAKGPSHEDDSRGKANQR